VIAVKKRMRGAQLGGVAMLCAEIVIAVILTKVRSSLLCLGRRKTQQTVERARTTPNRQRNAIPLDKGNSAYRRYGIRLPYVVVNLRRLLCQ